MNQPADVHDAASLKGLGRLAAVLYCSGGLVYATSPLYVPETVNSTRLGLIGLLAITIGGIVFFIPWDRFPRLALLIPPALGLVVIGGSGVLAPNSHQHFLPLYLLVFAFMGVSQRPFWTLATVPAAIVSFVLGVGGNAALFTITSFVTTLTVGVAVGVTLARFVERQRQATHRMETLLRATRRITQAASTEETARMLEAAACEALAADLVLTFATEHPGAHVLTNIAPAAPPLNAKLTIDLRFDQGKPVLNPFEPVLFVSDISERPDLARGMSEIPGIRSLLLVALPGEGGCLGALVIGWSEEVRRLDPLNLRACEILATQAGPVLEKQRTLVRVRLDAETDGLTGLLNRRSIEQRVDAMTAGDSVVVIDLDHFKDINDRHGHAAGDEVLRSLGRCLMASCRTDDWSGRLGGEEFVLVLKNAGIEGARQTVERVRERWLRSAPLITTSFSTGIAVHAADRSPRESLAHADDALYEAKRAGRDCTRVHGLGVTTTASALPVVD